jgi:hypothetical protein
MESKPPALRGDAVAKTAKTANPRELAVLAVLGRAGGLLVAEAGGTTTGCGMGGYQTRFPG